MTQHAHAELGAVIVVTPYYPLYLLLTWSLTLTCLTHLLGKDNFMKGCPNKALDKHPYHAWAPWG